MPDITILQGLFVAELPPAGDVILLGSDSHQHIFVEQDDAEHDQTRLWRIDPDGQRHVADPASLPEMIASPASMLDHPLNFRGLRWRGMREPDRVAEWVLPLTIMQKIPLLSALDWDQALPLLLGIGESQVISYVDLTPTQQIVCRRIRLLYALSQVAHDEDGLPYDYDSLVLHIIHAYDPVTDTAPDLHLALTDFAGMRLISPMDCFISKDRLVVADQGDTDHPPRILVWRIIPDTDH